VREDDPDAEDCRRKESTEVEEEEVIVLFRGELFDSSPAIVGSTPPSGKMVDCYVL
jgi:hypothetical protein